MCKKRLRLEQFYRHGSRGRCSDCKDCTKERKRRQYARGKSRIPEPTGSIYYVRIPARRVAKVVLAATDGDLLYKTDPTLARYLHRMKFEQENVRFDHLDKILIKLGLEGLWHVPPEQGGFADIYESDLRCDPNASAKTPAARTAKNQHLAGGGPSPSGAASPLSRRRASQRKKAA
jgi:hypothetical protein